MVHVFYTSSHGGLCVKFHKNISNGLRVMERTRNYEAVTDGRTDGRTDTQNFGRYKLIPRHLRGLSRGMVEKYKFYFDVLTQCLAQTT